MSKSEFIKARDEAAKYHKNNSVDSGMSEETAMYYGVLYGADWAYEWLIKHKGQCINAEIQWNERFKDLEQKLAVAVEVLEFYANGRHLWAESEAKPGNVCDPIGFYAQQALAKIKGK